MALDALTAHDLQIVHACLECVAAGVVIPHDWEFQAIMGVEPADLRAVLDAWPEVDDSDETASLTINNSFANLLGYPHAYQDDWTPHIPVARADVERVFDKWRNGRAI